MFRQFSPVNTSYKNILQQIKENNITEVDLSHQPLSLKQMDELCNALINNTSVTKLLLNNCKIDDDCLEKLVNALVDPTLFTTKKNTYQVIHPEVTKLTLTNSSNGNKTLTSLSLRQNNFSDKVLESIQTLLLGNHTLTNLNLSDNSFSPSMLMKLKSVKAFNEGLINYFIDIPRQCPKQF
ncbi:MAG: hypothetical protein ACD_46C00731G0005 [uncultured bacterium]|nr:MAG: hypothetical protein ACD_46C00731G0005 [uncultured bacterium]